MLEPYDSEDDPEPAPNPDELRREIATYRAVHLAEHLSTGPASKLSALLDRGFLADQVTTLGNYAAAGRTLEMVLPKSRDEDFFRYTLTNLALRQLATRLDDENTARAILRIGSSELVVGLAEQLTRPFDQARIRAMLAAAKPDHPTAAQWRRQAIDIVDSFFESPRSALEPEDLDGLETVLAELAGGPDLGAAWARWQQNPLLSADLLQRLRTALLVSLWRRGNWSDPWAQLETSRHPAPDQLGWQLGKILADQEEDQLAKATHFFAGWLAEDADSAWRLLLPTAQRLALLHPERAKRLWLVGTEKHTPPAQQLDEKSLPLLRVLDATHLDLLSRLLPEGSPANLLAIARLDPEDPQSSERTRFAIAALKDPAARLRASLLLAEQIGQAKPALARESLRQTGLALEAMGYGFDAAWLVFYLELLTKYDIGSLERELHEIVFSPGCTPATLLALAANVASESLFKSLLSQVERFSIAVAEYELAAFELRAAVLAELGRRLPFLSQGLELLDQLTSKQLLEEEEALRLELATHLLHEGRDEEARQVAEKLQPGPSRRLAEIRLLGTGPRASLDAAEIFTVFFDIGSIEDELWGLRSLLESPLDLESSFEEKLGRILDPDTRSLFVLHLVGHRATFEKKHFGRLRDASSLLEMARPLLVIEDEHRLAELAPELVELGKLAGPKTALNELLECAEGLARLGKLDGESLLEAFDSLLLTAIHDKDPAVAAPFCDALLHLPALWSAAHPRSFELRRLIPRIVSMLELLPEAKSLFRTPSPRGARWLSRLGKNWELDQEPWPQIVELASLQAADRPARIAGWPPNPDLLEAGIVLLPDIEAELALQLLEKMPQGERRERLVMRLIKWGRFPADRPRLRRFLADERLQRLALLFEHLEQDDAAFLENLADAVSHGEVDTHDPAAKKILHRLWRCSPTLSQETLGKATRNAFRRGGKIAESALRVWLHAHLAPLLGEEQPAKLERWHQYFAAAQRARRLDYRQDGPS